MAQQILNVINDKTLEYFTILRDILLRFKNMEIIVSAY